MGISGLHDNRSGMLSPHEITQFFMEQGTLVTFQKGQNIFSPGEAGDRIYLINHGEVKVFRGTNDGKEIILELLGAGAIFGEAEAISNSDWKNAAVAKRDCILHSISKEALLAKMGKDPKIAMWLVQRVGSKQLETENLLESLLFKSANAKVAGILLDLAKNFGRDMEEGTLIDYMITHQEIGNSIATTRETVSYAFMEFRQMGLIDTIKRRTVIKNTEGLQALAQAA
jgi:CRP/FNR family transcriptional regulator